MGKLIEEYKRKKAMIGKPSLLYVIESNRDEVIIKEVEILSIEGDFHKIGQYPYDVVLKNDKDMYRDSGYGTGFGDIWSWSYFASLDKDVAYNAYLDEKKRVFEKYQDPNRLPEPEYIAPIG